MSVTSEWDAGAYDAVGSPVARRSAALVARLPLAGNETVLDAGCGTGRITELLRARLPHGRVIALDGSQSMLDVAAARLGHDRVEYVQADLGRRLDLDVEVDAIVSTATIHWVGDHDQLFASFARVLRPGGWISFECAGEGNGATLVAALRDAGCTTLPWTFANDADTAARLERAGFVGVDARLEPYAVTMGDERLRAFLQTVMLPPFTGGLPPPDANALVERVAERMDGRIDFVRLVVDARLPPLSTGR